MTDHLDRAAEVIAAQMHGLTTPSMCRGIARALEEAGMLAFPERDAAVAARALREAADTFARFANSASTSERSRHGWESARGVLLRMAEEREAGVSDADA